MTEDDLDDVLRIERLSFTTPWSRALFENELKNPVSCGMVAKVGGPGAECVAAYIVFWVVHGEAHILNIAVHPDFRRRGLGSRLLDHALGLMEERGVRGVFLEVRRSNRAARRMYGRFGFRELFVRRRYYGDEDALVMALDLRERAGGGGGEKRGRP
ncbi:MAG TPA: ribosomal-protein-alanine N-acetyltransferase [Deltaproteobacteria bacterium]|nr:ribosomal-protein-alanine N-acetyltransferase [Deltaproteobacteria bacterium]